MRTSVCEPWAEFDDSPDCRTCADASITSGAFDRWIGPASDALFVLSGRQFNGPCTATIRPCHRPSCLSTRDRCCCRGASSIRLSPGPVSAVAEVKIDGDVIDDSLYALRSDRYLVRTDGESWPSCQRLDLADTEPETMSVSIVYGMPPPRLGSEAAAELACELALACSPNAEKCRLPKRVQQVTKQQVTYVMLDPAGLIDENGSTGLPIVDLFLRTYNPKKLRRRASVWSPDLEPAPTRTA